MAVARLAYTNLMRTIVGAVLSASSEASGFPKSNLLDEDRGRKARTKQGYNPHALLSDQLTFLDNGVAKTAQLTAGSNFQTPALYAAHVTSQMNAVATTNTYLVSYNTGTLKYTIARATGAGTFGLPFATGAAVTAGRSAHLDLGFASTDVTGSTSYTAGNVSYKGREFFTVDLLTAQALTTGAVIEHNLGTGGTIRLQGHTVDTAAGWVTPDFNQVLAGDGAIRVLFFGSTSKRYWRLLIDDVSSNSSGYTELGVWFIGTWDEPSKNFIGESHEIAVDDLSTISRAISGAHKRDARPAARGFAFTWKTIATDRTKLKAWATACPVGACSFIFFDPVSTPTDFAYGYFTEGLTESPIGRLMWAITRHFLEALP